MTQYSQHSWNHTLQVYQLSPLNFALNLQDSTTVYIGMYFSLSATVATVGGQLHTCTTKSGVHFFGKPADVKDS